MDDHDLLIRLDTKLQGLVDSIKSLHDDTVGRINDLYSIKASKSDVKVFKDSIGKLHEDMEERIRSIEKFTWGAIGILAIIQLIGLPLIFKFIL